MQLKALWRVDVTSEDESREAVKLLIELAEDHSGDDRVLEQVCAATHVLCLGGLSAGGGGPSRGGHGHGDELSNSDGMLRPH